MKTCSTRLRWSLLKKIFIILILSGAQLAQAQGLIAIGQGAQPETVTGYSNLSCFQVTAAQNQESDAVWNLTPINIKDGFDFNFKIFLGNYNPDHTDGTGDCGVGADGLCFVLQDNAGYTVVKNIQVEGSQPVLAAFSTSVNVTQAQTNILFTGSATNAATYNWDFGDGATGSGISTSHSYQAEGVYNVILTVSSSTGCTSATAHTITITPRSATGINTLTDNGKISIWSNENKVYVDFTKQTNVDAQVDIYNVIGQLLSSEKFGRSAIYIKEIDFLEAEYLVIKVTNEDSVTTKKVFIANLNK